MDLQKKIPILPADCDCRARYLSYVTLPENYMGDFSLMGLVVDRYREALALLETAGWKVVRRGDGAEIILNHPQQLATIKELFTTENIHCDYSDIADTLYQA